jgi:hypothetical protein
MGVLTGLQLAFRLRLCYCLHRLLTAVALCSVTVSLKGAASRRGVGPAQRDAKVAAVGHGEPV